MRLIGWPLSLFFAAQFAVFALLDFGSGETARLMAIGLQALLLVSFVVWRFGLAGGGWPSQQACAYAFLLAASALSLIFIEKPGIQVGIMLGLLHVVDRTAGPAPDEIWPPEPDPPADALWPRPSPAKSGFVAFLGSVVVCLSPNLETFFNLGLFFVALMLLRGFAVAHHVNWRPMPLWRPGLLRLYGPIIGYTVFVIGLHGVPSLQRGLVGLASPFLLLATSAVGEYLGRRWMARRGSA